MTSVYKQDWNYEADIIICSSAVSEDRHVKLQRFKAEQTTSTFSLAHLATRRPQTLKIRPRATDEKMKSTQRERGEDRLTV